MLKGLRGATRLRAAGTALGVVVAAGVVAASALAVVNGKPDGNAHPYVGVAVSQAGELCSGSLLSPTVFLTAGHCFTDGTIVLVDVQESLASDHLATAVPGVVHVAPIHPATSNGLAGSATNDLAVVTLFSPGLSVDRYPTLPAQGYVDKLPNNQRVDIVGYGVQDPSSHVAGTRLSAPAKIISGGGATGEDYLKISSSPGQGGGATCFGDSGGPDLQGDVILAVSSHGASATCSAVDYSQRVDTDAARSFLAQYVRVP